MILRDTQSTATMSRESKANRTQRMRKIVSLLNKAYPDARCMLNRGDPLQLLVATILSAQCTDVRVNIVTAELFKKYHTVSDYAGADLDEFQQEIRSTGFYRNKAKNIIGAATLIIDRFDGEVPDNMEDLLTLPGVARKTANVVLSDAFGKSDGIVVDTHVMRISKRLKFTNRENNQGDKIEKDLLELLPHRQWAIFSHLLIFHGRACCKARKPNCPGCPISHLCPWAGKV